NNSGQNSGRVTPTSSLSRRSSAIGNIYSGGGGGGGNGSASPNGLNGSATLSVNGNGSTSNNTSLSASATAQRSSSSTLMPPNLMFERKLSCSFSSNGDLSPEMLSPTIPIS